MNDGKALGQLVGLGIQSFDKMRLTEKTQERENGLRGREWPEREVWRWRGLKP